MFRFRVIGFLKVDLPREIRRQVKMSVNEKAQESSQNYNHGQLCDEVDRINRQLEDMLEIILDTSVRAHLLEADLATLFDPSVAEILREAKQECEKCTQSVYGVQ